MNAAILYNNAIITQTSFAIAPSLAIIQIMQKLLLLFSSFLALAMPAFANTPKAAFAQLNACVKAGKTSECRDKVTASSVDLYDRFASYGLTQCLPHDVAYVSNMPSGEYQVIRASTNALGGQRYMRFYFTEEEGQWKLDVPQSLRVSMGENWEKQVGAAEQLYLVLKSQMGDQLGCGAVQTLVQKQSKPAS